MVASPAPNVRIVGRYALYGAIASGGMATVHFGRLLGPVGFSRTVAIKRLHAQFASDPEFVSMFLDEARLAARIRHPHVVPTLDVVATNGELFLVMDYVPGESLSRLVRVAKQRGEAIPIRVTVAIMSGVLQGLHAAHEAKNERGEPLGIVHRDVSPQNILVGSDGQARVLDFGVAKAAGRVQTTREGQLKGKLMYMAPEQLRGETVTRRTDLYAAAVVLWEALTRQRLFAGDNEGAVVTRVLEGSVQPPSRFMIDPSRTIDSVTMHLYEALDEVVMRGLSRDAAHRFDTGREMALALEKCGNPATAAEVGEWVEHVAKGSLLERAELIAEIESSSSNMPRPLGATQPMTTVPAAHEDATGAPDNALTTLSQPGVSQPGPGDLGLLEGGAQPPTQVSSLSVASNAFVERRSRRGRTGIAIVAATLFVGVASLFVAFWHDPRSATAAAPSSSSSSGAPVALPSPDALTPTPVSSPFQPSSQPSGAAPPASVAAVPLATKSSRVVPSKPGAGRHPAPAPKPAADCNPPYTWAEDGSKHYKPNCI